MSKIFRGIILSLVLTALFTFAAAAGDSGTCGDNLRWTLDDSGTLTITGTGEMESYGYSYTTFTGYVTSAPWFESRAGLKSVVIQEGATSIGAGAFASCTSVKSVSIPASVTSIGKAAFGNCTGLTSVTYGGTAAQWNAVSVGEDNGPLTSAGIQYGSGGQSGGGTTSDRSGKCGDNATWFLDDSGTLIIKGTGEMKWLVIPPWYDYREDITLAVIYQGITSIAYKAFYGCSNMSNVTIPDTIQSIESYAFYNCKSLYSINLPDKIATIKTSTFSGCTSLRDVVLPEMLSSIESYAFYNCESLKAIVFSDKLTSIGERSFSKCSKLTSIKVPSGISKIPKSSFSDCTGLTDVVLPDNIAEIAEYAFIDCSSLKNITLAKNITAIREGAFALCSSLNDVYYSGTTAQWEAINIESVNERLTNADIHYESSNHVPNVPVVFKFGGLQSVYSFPYYEDSIICCAAYDKDGKMIALDMKDYDEERFIFAAYDGEVRGEFFFLDSRFIPQRKTYTITINYV